MEITLTQELNDTCLYIHTRKDDGRIFYVGIGSKKRPYEKSGRNIHWNNTVKTHNYNVTILVDCLTWSRACELEMLMIAFYGRRDKVGGILVNKTDGGDGHKNPTDETRKAIGDANRKLQDIFIEQCKEVHSNTYDYSKVLYIGQTKKIIIVCYKHGNFKQNAGNHVVGHGCPKCAIETLKICQLKEHDIFIEQCKEVHGDTYDYDKVEYKGHTKKVTIICKEHGEFKQSAGGHLSGRGCGPCGELKRSNSRRKDQVLFIEQSKEVHKNKYTYDKVDYASSTKKVTITCKTHGDFKQVPPSHLFGNGCPCCANDLKNTPVLDINTGVYYDSIKEVIELYGINRNFFTSKKNKTSFRKV